VVVAQVEHSEVRREGGRAGRAERSVVGAGRQDERRRAQLHRQAARQVAEPGRDREAVEAQVDLAVAALGPPWRAAGTVLAALAGVTAGLPLIVLGNEVFKSANRPDLVPRVTLLITVGTVALIVAFLPFGVAGVAGGLSLVYVVAAAYALNNVTRVLALPRSAILAELWGPLVASALMAGGLALFAEYVVDLDGASTLTRLGWLLGEACLAVLIYAAGASVLARATAREFVLTLLSLVHRRRAGQPV
jgi:hypothetical protein